MFIQNSDRMAINYVITSECPAHYVRAGDLEGSLGLIYLHLFRLDALRIQVNELP